MIRAGPDIALRSGGPARAMRQPLSITLAIIAVLALFTNATAFADAVGYYKVSGTMPSDGSPYSGEVVIDLTGRNVVRVVWDIGGERYVGTGISSQNYLAISYRRGNAQALALFSQGDNGTWSGMWTYVDDQKIGTERWAPK